MTLPRVAFQLRIRAGREADYDQAHRNVFPELLAKLHQAGIRHYSIFRRGQQLFLYMQVADFTSAQTLLKNDPANLRWQAKMAELFEPVPDLQPGEDLAMMEEVFYME